MNASEAASRWIAAKITGAGNTEQIERTIAPKDAPYPLIVLQWTGGGINYFTGRIKHKTRVIYTVKCWAKGWDTAPAAELDSRVHAALSAAPAYDPAPGGFQVMDCFRESDWEFTQTEPDGTVYRGIGGVYQLTLY